MGNIGRRAQRRRWEGRTSGDGRLKVRLIAEEYASALFHSEHVDGNDAPDRHGAIDRAAWTQESTHLPVR
jgi:hypothetical protein